MENDQNLELEQEQNEETGEAEVPKPRPKLTPEQAIGRIQRQLTRLVKEFGLEATPASAEEIKSKSATPAKKESFGYDELAFLEVRGIKFEDDQKRLLEEMNATGRDLKAVLGFRHIQDELKQRADDRKTAEALPESVRAGGSFGKNSVEYWLARGGYPQGEENRALREQIVNARMKKEGSSAMFTDQPLV